jgi:hypothetical protein
MKFRSILSALEGSIRVKRNMYNGLEQKCYKKKSLMRSKEK